MEVEEDGTTSILHSFSGHHHCYNSNNSPMMDSTTPLNLHRKRKVERQEGDCTSAQNKKYRTSSPALLSELLEHCTLNKAEGNAMTMEEEEEGKKLDLAKAFLDAKLAMEQVNTAQIIGSITADFVERGDVLMEHKTFQHYYKSMFNVWRTASTMNSGRMHVGNAIQIWLLLLKNRCFFFDAWVAFLMERRVTYLSRDQWNLFFEFCVEFHPRGFQEYDMKAAWPTLMDDFVVFYQERV